MHQGGIPIADGIAAFVADRHFQIIGGGAALLDLIECQVFGRESEHSLSLGVGLPFAAGDVGPQAGKFGQPGHQPGAGERAYPVAGQRNPASVPVEGPGEGLARDRQAEVIIRLDGRGQRLPGQRFLRLQGDINLNLRFAVIFNIEIERFQVGLTRKNFKVVIPRRGIRRDQDIARHRTVSIQRQFLIEQQAGDAGHAIILIEFDIHALQARSGRLAVFPRKDQRVKVNRIPRSVNGPVGIDIGIQLFRLGVHADPVLIIKIA